MRVSKIRKQISTRDEKQEINSWAKDDEEANDKAKIDFERQ